jgi:hypothetical protein
MISQIPILQKFNRANLPRLRVISSFAITIITDELLSGVGNRDGNPRFLKWKPIEWFLWHSHQQIQLKNNQRFAWGIFNLVSLGRKGMMICRIYFNSIKRFYEGTNAMAICLCSMGKNRKIMAAKMQLDDFFKWKYLILMLKFALVWCQPRWKSKIESAPQENLKFVGQFPCAALGDRSHHQSLKSYMNTSLIVGRFYTHCWC